MGCGLAPRFLVRSAELNRDLVREAAPELARRIAGTPSHWFGRSDAAYYPARHGREVDGNLAVATWRNGRRDAPVHYKFYAKTEGLLRVEVALANRRAVVLFGGGADHQGPAAGGAELALRLGALATKACPLLSEMTAHVGRFQAPSGGVLDLLAALAPLLSLAGRLPRSKPGGRAGAVTRDTPGARSPRCCSWGASTRRRCRRTTRSGGSSARWPATAGCWRTRMAGLRCTPCRLTSPSPGRPLRPSSCRTNRVIWLARRRTRFGDVVEEFAPARGAAPPASFFAEGAPVHNKSSDTPRNRSD